MIRRISHPKAAALLIVLGIILIAVILANAIMNIMLSQSRLTQHQVNRIQAYYANLAGMNYALDRLRVKDPDWNLGIGNSPITKTLCRSGCNITELNLPTGIRQVNITIGPDVAGRADFYQINITTLYNNNTNP